MRYTILQVLLFTFLPLLAAAQESPESPQRRAEWLRAVRGRDARKGAQARIDAIRKMRAQASNASSAAGQWNLIGPQPQDTLGITSGRVTALAVDPRDPNVAYAGGAEGGVWKTIDGGSTWAPLTDQQVSLSTGAIELDPLHPDTIYAGTGEANENGDSYGGAGILKSTDAGATWTNYPGPFVGAPVSQIAISPSNPQILLAGSNPRLYRSADGGVTWTPVLAGMQVSAVLFHSTDGNTAFAAMGALRGGAASGIYKSTDAGKTWNKLTGIASNGLPVSDLGRTVLAADPSRPSTFYAGITSLSDGNHVLGLYKTIDSGATWTTLNPGYCDSQCWYNNALAVDPRNPSVLYGGGSTLRMSIDAGVTWQSVMETSDPSLIGGTCCLHPDQHALAFSRDGSRLYVGNDGGVYRTNSIGSAIPVWTSLNASLALTQFYPGMSLHPTDSSIIYGGTQDNGTLRYNGGMKWNHVQCGDGGATAIDPAHPSTVYVFCNGGSLFKSRNNGLAGSYQPAGGISEPLPFVPYLAVDASNPSTLYVAAARHVFQSRDGAATWSIASPDIALGKYVCSIAVSPTDSNTVYAGTCTGAVWATSSAALGAGSTWNLRSAGLPGGSAILHITPDAANPLIAYVALGDYGTGHIFRTSDGGVTWNHIGGNLPDIPVNELVIDPDLSGVLYTATDIGVFWTTDGGRNWTPLMNGMPQAAVTSLGFMRSTRTLVAATHGRSVWQVPLPLASLRMVPSITSISPGTLMQGAGSSTLTVLGSNFADGSVVLWNGQARPTGFVSAAQLTVALSDVDLMASGQFTVAVSTPPPGGGVSASAVLTVSARSPTAPLIRSGGVVTASQFGAYNAIAPGAWIEIYGANLAATRRMWTAADLVSGTAPTSLDHVSVTIGGQPAFIEFVDPAQINALAPSNLAPGPQQLIVTAPGGASAPYTVQVDAAQSGLLAPPSLLIDGKQYAGALQQDGQTFAGPATPAKPGDILTIYGVGFGPVTPDIAAGVLAEQSNSLTLPVSLRIGGVEANALYFGLAPGLTGVYQFNVVVPDIPDDPAAPLTFTLGGKAGSQSLYIAIRRQ